MKTINPLNTEFHMTRGSLMITAATVAALLSTASGFAGDVLRLRTEGDIRIQDQTYQMMGTMTAGQTGIFVVQFNAPVTPEQQNALRSNGIAVLRYLPEDALIVRGSLAELSTVRVLMNGVRAVVRYSAEWKISPEFSSRTGHSVQRELIIVSAIDADSLPSVQKELSLISGVEIANTTGRDTFVMADVSRLEAISKIEGVEWIQPAPIFQDFALPMDDTDRAVAISEVPPYTGYETGTKIMNFDAAWARGFNGAGQIVAVGDTGLDSGKKETLHPDFVDHFVSGYAVGLGGKSWEDSMGHGTHVAGSVGGTGRASEGRIKGGANGAGIISMGLWSPILDNLAPGSDFNRIVGPAYKDGARIHTNSWGQAANFGEYDTFASRVDEYMWNNPEMLVLFAAGNSGVDANRDGRIDPNSIGSPGTAKNVLTVGASENLLAVGGIQRKHGELRDGDKNWGVEPLKSDTLSNNPNGIACFSSRGPTKDGRTKPEIVAPGTNIVSTRSHHPKASALWGEYDSNYVYAGGTSMATPLTAGAAAVVRQFLTQARGVNAPTAALVKAVLMHTATDLFPGQYGTGPQQEIQTPRPNSTEGYGRVDMDFATRLGQETIFVDDKIGVGVNEEKAFAVNVQQGTIIRATMSYTDAPGAASAAKTLVNDLDLVVIAPNGDIKRLSDRVNNSEMIEFVAGQGGTYQVKVVGVNVPQGKNSKQPFAAVLGVYSAR